MNTPRGQRESGGKGKPIGLKLLLLTTAGLALSACDKNDPNFTDTPWAMANVANLDQSTAVKFLEGLPQAAEVLNLQNPHENGKQMAFRSVVEYINDTLWGNIKYVSTALWSSNGKPFTVQYAGGKYLNFTVTTTWNSISIIYTGNVMDNSTTPPSPVIGRVDFRLWPDGNIYQREAGPSLELGDESEMTLAEFKKALGSIIP